MLTINDIKSASFRRANFGGYKPEDVDAFIDEVQISFEQMIKEKEELLSTIKKLNERINKFHEEDNSIKSVILNAQRIAEKSLSDAKVKTADMINGAAQESEKMIANAKEKVSAHADIANKLKEASSKLRKQLEDIYEKHIELIKEIPEDIEVSDEMCIKALENEKVSTSQNKVDIKDFKSNNLAENTSTGDIFSSDELEQPHRKFENLKFGNKATCDKDKQKNRGAYLGIFKKK